MPSAKTVLMKYIKTEFQKVRGGRYFVHRGAIDWASFDFVNHPFAVALFISESTFLRQDGIQRGIISLELACEMRALQSELIEVDDERMDEMMEDLEIVFQQVLKKRVNGDNVLFKLDHDAIAIEFSDAERKVQGFTIDIETEF